jgi:hypothetical protein
MIEDFEKYLRGTNLADNTVKAYLFAMRQFSGQFGSASKKNLQAYKVFLIEKYKPQTVNLRLRGINCYLETIG